MSQPPLFALVAGELSGDILGSGLIHALRERYPTARYVGVGGDRMIAAGLECWYPLETLSVMGLIEVLAHLPSLWRLQQNLYRRFSAERPAVFIGIDAPDFNLRLARRLHHKGIPTVHYVSPSVWAWRQGRVKQIARDIDLMLTLFPFEAEFYREHQVAVSFVGHPLADEISLQTTAPPATPVLALLPGSRMGEVQRLAPLFIATAQWLYRRRPDFRFILPAATPKLHAYLQALPQADLPIELWHARSRDAMSAASVVLSASGTATLEALLLHRPLVVAYKVARLTAFIVSRLLQVDSIALPNLLAGRKLVDEITQQDATPERLGQAVLELLENEQRRTAQLQAFHAIHRQLRRNASRQAAAAIGQRFLMIPDS